MKKTQQSFNSTLKMGSCELKRRPLKPISDKRLNEIKNAQDTGLLQSEHGAIDEAAYYLKNNTLKRVSDKRKGETAEYNKLKAKLILDRWRGFYFESELNGVMTKEIELHHLDGRQNGRLVNPFNVIAISHSQHEFEGAHHSFERIQELKAIVKIIRLAQGFKESDYD